ncbi:MAG TPA: LON peptidase substrate-binding domain-containing protein [Solirubrobacteraceae bacterium]|jgi:Lon protease-like protein|nr:LON peptidase substrate-binding domain-containing protein [Solirubrobacteraceae bacterium]
MGGRVDAFPLFPLGIVALPHELVPLHIFEPRYRAMIARCLDRELEFGIVWSGEDGLRSTGCACRIDSVLRRFEDGRMDILTRGTRPLRIHGSLDDVPYPAGTVEFLDDKDEEPHPPTVAAAHDAYAELVREVTDEEPDRERLESMDAYAMAATVELGLAAKQGLLDLRSENARLRLVTRLFRGAIRRLDFIDRATARARSNGKVRFG